MTATVKGWGTAVADNLNPFSRLVHTAAADDGAMNVPHFQLEKVKEAAFQSDYGLDCVAKAIMAHLDYPSVVVKLKTLQLVRFLMLEGPAAFSAKTSVSMGKFASMGIALQDARPNTVEASVRSLAQAIHEAFQGKTGALHRAFGENDQLRNVAGQEGSGAHGKAKSDFQEAQERQAKLYRKQREQEARNRDIIVLDKAYEQFDSNLTAPKLVASAVQSQKKKHADPELNNFAHATSEHARPAEVAAALDAVLKDSREPIQNRFKALMIVDYLISTQPIAEVITYFKANTAGLQRTLQLVDSSPKGQQMTAVTQQLLSRLPTISVPRPSDRSSSAGSHHDSSSAAAASPPPPTPPVKPAQPVLGASNVNPAFDGGPVLDTMFGQMEVRKPASGRPRGNSTTSSSNNAAAGSGAWPTSNSGAASGGVNSGAANWSWDAPAGASAANSTAAVAGTASVGAWGASWGGESALAPAVAASSSWQSQPPQQQPQQPPRQQQQQQQQQQAPLSPEEQLRLMQEQFQSNMAAMAALAGGNPMMPPMQQQFQQQPQHASQQASLMMASPSSGSYPPPQPQSTASMEQHNDDSPLDSKSQPQSPVGALAAAHGASSGVAYMAAARNANSGGAAAAAAASSSQASPAVPLWGSSVMEPPPLDVNGDDEHNAAERPSAPVPGAAPSVQPTPAGSRASHSIQFDLSVGSLASPAGMLSQNHHLGGPAHQHYVDPADNSSQALPSVSMTPLLVPNQQSPKSHNTTPQQQTPPTSTVGNGSNGGGRVTVEMLQQLQAQMQQTHEILQRQQLMYAHMQQRYMAQQQEDLARMSAQMHHRTS